MFDALLTILIWLIGGYFSAEFIIKWNQRHLLGKSINPKKIATADRLNANLSLDGDISVSTWRTVLILMGPITIFKAALLRLLGGSIEPKKEINDEHSSSIS
jgi:hypothetical protein